MIGPTASVMVGEKTTAAPLALVASMVRFGAVIAGGVVSRTVTVKVFEDVFPAPSVAVTVTAVVPIAKVDPDGIEYATVTGPTASVTVGANVTTAPAALVASIVALARLLPHCTSDGQRIGNDVGGGVLVQSVLARPEFVSWNEAVPWLDGAPSGLFCPSVVHARTKLGPDVL